MATLKDVAKDAGVSIATVSCCLSGSKNVKPETKMRIMDSIEKLKYIPNSSARSLKKNVSNSVGVVLTNIDETFHAEIFKGISSCLQKKGFTTNVAFSDNIAFNERNMIEEFIGENVSGLLIITSMPDNTEFFQNRVINYGIPSVFIEHKPKNIDVNYVGFDNRKTVYHLTKQLLDCQYRKIALITGSKQFTSEANCIMGYQEAFSEKNIPVDLSLIQETNMSKEDSFKTVLANLDCDFLEAIITTSENIAFGVLEALRVQNISVPNDVQLITLSEECWNQSTRIPGAFHTSRSAFELGFKAADLLIRDIHKNSPVKQQLLLEDRIISVSPSFPVPRNKRCNYVEDASFGKPFRVLMVDLPSSRAAKLLSGNFTKTTGILCQIDLLPHNQLLHAIENDMKKAVPVYDIYMYDVPWLPYMVQNSLIANISDFVKGSLYPISKIFSSNLDGCFFQNQYYGVPFISGSQILFYRKDIFENHQIQKSFKKQYSLSLRPPKTWTEFNHIARFFTQSIHPDSPTQYGTSVAGIVNEELAPELLVRIWGEGGNLWDEYKRATLNTPVIYKAFQSLLETVSYCEHNPFKTSIMDTVADFSSGKTAMLLTYSEYASQVSKSMYQNIIGEVGYALLPGKASVNVGWNLGMNPYSSRQDDIFRFFGWLNQEQTGYYLTIMGGQPPVKSPYYSNEITKLYPWLELTEPSFSHCRKRMGPVSANSLIVPQNRIEQILCCAFQDVYEGKLSLEASLSKWQLELEYLFKSYGYPKPIHFLNE